jgi:hypothetical protein
MRALIVAAGIIASATSTQAEENKGSANYMLPLCKTWLKIGIDKDIEAFRNILRTDPIQLTTSGMRAGTVVGIAETLRTFELACPPKGVTNDQLVRMVISEVERHPEKLHEDFIVPAAAVMMASWPCPK